MGDKTRPAVTIMLDKERSLLFDLNGMIAFKNETGINVLDSKAIDVFAKDMTPEILRAFFWACLTHEDDSITLFDAGKFIHMGNMDEIVDKLQLAWGNSLPEGGKEDAAPLAPRPNRKSRRG